MKIKFDRFPDGKGKALTFSYDDGRIHDRRLVSIFNEHRMKGTFHLNSGMLGKANYVEQAEIKALFAGHEVSAHTVTHPFLEQTPRERVVLEILEDRRSLEQIVGYPVRGMSYPYGTFNQEIVDLLPALGIRYARTVRSTGAFSLPSLPTTWDPTCHHRDMLKQGEAFLAHNPKHSRLSLLYVWGHSYEFENNQNWEDIETFCRMMAGNPDIWYATNMEIIDYLDALKRLQFSVDETMVHNPSAVPVWVSIDGLSVEVPPGESRLAAAEE